MQYAILSDIHANMDALRAVLAHIPPHLPIWFLGDAVGYYPDYHEVLTQLVALRQAGRLHVWLKGNHDLAAYDAAARSGMSTVARAAIELTSTGLSQSEKDLLRELPETPHVVADTGITVSHAAPKDPLWEYLENEEVAAGAAAHYSTRVCLVGHTHLPRKFYQNARNEWKKQEWWDGFTFSSPNERKVFLNPGSVGQPRDGFGMRADGFPHAAYALLDTQTQTFTLQRVRYDIAPIQERTRGWLRGKLEPQIIEFHVDRLRTNMG